MAVQRPTSARPGARGIIHPDRTIEGWVGGSCAQPIVVREALRSLADGRPRLLRLSRTGLSDSRSGDGILEYVMTCHSGGTLEIYVEPHLPRPALWVAGTTPIAAALVQLGAATGYRVTLFDPAAEAGTFPSAERVLADTELASLDPGAAPHVVVATQGQWDEEALAAALRRPDCAYVGLISSPTRAAAIREYLREEGIPGELVAALRAPAGLDLGAETPEEVALSILAELVHVRRRAAQGVLAGDTAAGAGTGTGHATGAGAGTAPAAILVAPREAGMVLRDPVCGMTVDREDVRHIAEHGGTIYAFCCVGCRSRFVKDPTAFVPADATPASSAPADATPARSTPAAV